MGYPLALLLAKTNTDGERGKLAMQPVRQDISHGASGGIPLAHTMTLDLWSLEKDLVLHQSIQDL